MNLRRLRKPTYEVSCLGHSCGKTTSFYRLSAAMAYFEKVRHSALHVTLTDMLNNAACLMMVTNSDRYPTPTRHSDASGKVLGYTVAGMPWTAASELGHLKAL